MEDIFSQSSDALVDGSANPPEGLPDGIYTYEGVDALYKKENGRWFKKIGQANYAPLQSGDVQERIKLLEEKAVAVPEDNQLIERFTNIQDIDVNQPVQQYKDVFEAKESPLVKQVEPVKKADEYKIDENNGVQTWQKKKEVKIQERIDPKTGQPMGMSYVNVYEDVTDPKKVAELNKKNGTQASTDKEQQIFTGYPGQEGSEYRINDDGLWETKRPGSNEFLTIVNPKSVSALNAHFKQNAEVFDDKKAEEIKEKNEYINNFNIRLNNINKDLIGGSEENAVETLSKLFPEFKFEKTGIMTDNIKVSKINNGVTVASDEISLDNFFDNADKQNAKVLKDWLRTNVISDLNNSYKAYNEAVAGVEKRISETIYGQDPEISKVVSDATSLDKTILNEQIRRDVSGLSSVFFPEETKKAKEAGEQLTKDYAKVVRDTYARVKDKSKEEQATAFMAIKTDDIIINAANNYSNEVKDNYNTFVSQQKNFNQYVNDINAKLKSGEISQEEYDNNYRQKIKDGAADLEMKGEKVKGDLTLLNYYVKGSEKAIASNLMIKEMTGTTAGAFGRSIVDGAMSVPTFIAGMNKEQRTEFIDSIVGVGTTEQYMQSKNRSDLTKAALSITRSISAMTVGKALGSLTGVPGAAEVGSYISLYAMGYNEMRDTLDGVGDISSEDKVLMSSLYALVGAGLENYGLSYLTQKTVAKRAASSWILKNAFSQISKNASKEMIEAQIMNSTKRYVSRAAITTAGSSLVEGGVEATQAGAQKLVQEAYDQIKGTNYFNNESAWKITGDILYEFKLGALGAGMVESAQQSVDVLSRGVNALKNNDQIKLLITSANVEGIDNALLTNLKASMLSGKMSKGEAKEIVESFKEIKGKINSMPEDMSIDNKSVALDLMIERDNLNKKIEGKDPFLVVKEKERIGQINEQLKNLGNAVQEPSTEGVLQREQEGVTETGGERGGVEPIVQGEEVTREGEATKEEVVIDKNTIQENSKSEVERVKSLTNDVEDGATFNLDGTKYEGKGLIVPVVSKNTTAEEVTPEMISNFVEEHKDKIGDNETVKVGIYKFPNSNKVSIDLNILAPESSRDQAIEFGKNADQESLFDLSTFENVKTGGTGVNPMQFTNDQFKEISKAFAEGRVPNVFGKENTIQEVTITPETSKTVNERINKETDTKRKKVFTAVQKVLSAIPNSRIILHDNADAFVTGVAKSAGITNDEAISQGVKNNRGSYVNGDIHINLETAGVTTVFHEAFHDLLAKKGMENNALLDMAKGLKSVISDKALKTRLDDFVSNYEQGERAEEYTTELGAIMAEAQKELSTTKFQQFKTLVNKIAKKLGMPVVFSAASTAQDAVDFMNSMSGKLGKGEQIEVGKAIKVDTNELSIKAKKIGDFDVSYFEDADDYKKLVENGSVENNYDINKIAGEVVAIHQPDNMFVGDLNYKGKNIFKGLGGVFYTLITGNVWASGAEKSAKNLANLINKSLKESTDGIGRLVLVRGSESKMISSTEGVKAAMSIIELLVDKGLINRSEFRSSLIRAGKKFNIDFSGKDSSAAIHKDIKEKFMDVKNSTFQKRGDFFDEVINDLSKTSKSASENKAEIRKVLGSKKQIAFSKDGIRDSIGYILTERLLQDLPPSHVYAIIEVTEPVTYEERKGHDSYPWVLKSKSKPKLKLLSDRGNAVKDGVFEMIDGSEVSFGKLGLAQAGIGIAKISQQPSNAKKIKAQIIGKNANLSQNVRDNLQVARDMENSGKSVKDIRIATGWERGADNKWRYEIPDNIEFFKDTIKTVREILYSYKNVDDISQKANYFLPEELLNLYPKLKNITIQFNKNGDEEKGYYDPVNNVINVNLGVYPENTIYTLLHEIQHAIQGIEGFAKGTSINQTKYLSIEKLINEIETGDDAIIYYKLQSLLEKSKIDKVHDLLNKYSIKKYNKKIDRSAYDLYMKYSGEVESRNVEKRMKMTPEERRQTTLQETEDIAREDQIIFFNEEGSQSKIKAQKVLPESVEKRLTEDGNGNYVFHHYSSSKRDSIKPTTGDGSFMVSKEEASALASVNGVAQYYAMADQKEQGTGNVQHTVLVPMDEVYYLQEDKLNLYDKAKEEFQKARPGQAFNPNYQAAWIGKVANDMGYKMLVSEWRNGELRAQTTLELKPEANNIEMKPREKVTFNVGDKVNVFGDDAVVTEVNGDIVSYKGDRSSGSINVVRSKQSIKKISSIKAQKQSKDDAIQDAKDKYELSVEKRGKDHKTGVTAAIADLQKSDWYRDADDTQREESIREIKKFFGEKLKAAPSVAKVTGKTKQTAFVSDLAAAIRDQVRLQARSSRETAKNINDRRKALGVAIKDVVKEYKGKITERQLNAINRKIANVNLFNQEMVERVIDYVNKVMNNAEYATKVNNAFAERRAIRRMMKSGNMAETVAVAKEFTQIDPSMVDDIDTYLEMAQKIRGAVKSSKRVKDSVSLKEIVNFGEAYEYINPILKAQEESMKNMLLAEYNDLAEAGVISKDMTLKDINNIIKNIRVPKDEKVTAEEEKTAREFLKQRLESIKSIISMVANGYNPLTGEVMEISDRNKQMIAKVVKSDMNNMSTKQLIEMVDSLSNFVENGAVSGIEAAYETYIGEENAASLEREGVVAKTVKLYASKKIGGIQAFSWMSLPELFNRMFGGVKNGIKVMTKMGFSDIILGANKAKKLAEQIQKRYVDKFGDVKGFFDNENIYERGALAFLTRNVIGSEAEIKSEFNRRVDWLFESFERLKSGTAEEQKMAAVYGKIIDKLDIKSRDLEKIYSNADKTNVEAVNWWVEEWSKHYSDLSDVSRSVYNAILGKDTGYTPDRLKMTSKESSDKTTSKEIKDLMERNSSFLINTDAITNTNESGVMIASIRPEVKDTKGRYVSLDFEINNIDSLTGALVDINTAGAIRRLDSFMKSKSFDKIIPNADDQIRIKRRINRYVRRIKNKMLVSSDSIRDFNKIIDTAASLGASIGLGGAFQIVKQTVSVAMSTALQTGGNFNIYAGKSFNDWLDTTGATVANRGQESISAIESANKKIQSFSGNFDRTLKAVSKATQWQLKLVLSRPDVFVARAAFKSYYEQFLKNNGYDVSKINWDTWADTIKREGIEELNKEAVVYADTMVSRQQNVSDERLAGEALASENDWVKLARKVLLPFASFSINQRARLINDLITIKNKTASKEDVSIAWKSLFGTLVEQATFQAINYSIGMLLYAAAQGIAGHDDDEEEWEKRKKRATQYPLRSLAADITSPTPLVDDLFIDFYDLILSNMAAPSESEINKAINDEKKLREELGKDFSDSQIKTFREKYIEDNTYQLSPNYINAEDGKWGMLSIASDQVMRLSENSEMATKGTFTSDYQGKETTKYLTDKDRRIAQGVFYTLDVPYTTGAGFKEMGQVANKTYSIIKKRALTENQYETYNQFKKDFKREPQEWEINLIKSTNSANNALGELDFIKEQGGLSPKQGVEYLNVFKKIGPLNPEEYRMIINGKKADQVIKSVLK